MSVNIKSNGELVTVASGQRIWVGTKQAWNNLQDKPTNCLKAIIDDGADNSPVDITNQLTFTKTYFTDIDTKTKCYKYDKVITISADAVHIATNTTGGYVLFISNVPIPITTINFSIYDTDTTEYIGMGFVTNDNGVGKVSIRSSLSNLSDKLVSFHITYLTNDE